MIELDYKFKVGDKVNFNIAQYNAIEHHYIVFEITKITYKGKQVKLKIIESDDEECWPVGMESYEAVDEMYDPASDYFHYTEAIEPKLIEGKPRLALIND